MLACVCISISMAVVKVFVAVGLPSLAFRDNSVFRPTLEGRFAVKVY